jgi:DNA-directed RNA polymerase sigma subunit (sigma70/sigma32)
LRASRLSHHSCLADAFEVVRKGGVYSILPTSAHLLLVLQKYCKVEKRMHEMRDELQRWPTMFELAANLGTTNIEGLKQFIAEGAECKRAAVYANLRLVVSITKRHNRTQKVSLSVRPLDRCMDF